VFNPEAQSADVRDTAALILNLDLIVTVDTMTAHLAGALCRRVWILLPVTADWRWMLERSDTPWYPSARLFRQRVPGDWSEVIETVRTALAVEAQRYAVNGCPVSGCGL
jgi:ADP-heptose:LPS heptosyltransferase